MTNMSLPPPWGEDGTRLDEGSRFRDVLVMTLVTCFFAGYSARETTRSLGAVTIAMLAWLVLQRGRR